MTTLLINNTEQVQPKDRNDTQFKLYGRRPENPDERIEVTVFGFDPYFYAPEAEVRDREDEVLRQDSVDMIDYGDFEGLLGESLARIYVPKPQNTRDARELFDQTWEADVPFTNRLRIDTGLRAGVEIPDVSEPERGIQVHWKELNPVQPDSPDANPGGNASETGLQDIEPRVVTLDIEADDRNGFPEGGNERILSIVAHDSYSDEVIGFVDGEGQEPRAMFPDGAPNGVDKLRVSEDENDMLVAFREWFNENDPDLVTGWNADDFDIPYIIERMENLDGLDPNTLSPLGWSGVTDSGEPRIKGRTVYDLLTVYKKNSFTELRSYRLEDVAQEEVNASKVEFDGSYYGLYENDPKKFIEYNAHDVNLCVEINREAGVIEFRDVLRREVGVDFEDSYDNKDFVDMMCRRRLKERGVAGPTRPEYGEEPDSDFEGAHVFEPFEGVAENVVGIDLASLYPYTMAMFNASPETKVDEDFDGPAAKAANDQWFRLDQDGIFKELVDDAIGLKAEYKEKLQAAETKEEREYWDVKYNTAKTITNSLYGVTGWERFFLYDEAVAEAVTLSGQLVIKRTAEYIEGWDHEVIYGDTDSTYVKFPDDWTPKQCVEEAKEICADLNKVVYPELASDCGIPPEDNLWEIEVEAHMVRYFQAGKKKRYAYVASWKDGNWLDEADVSVTGFSSKRSDSSRLTVETEQEVLDAILSGDSSEVSTIVFEAAQQIEPEAPDWELIGIPGGMNKKITDDPEKGESDAYYAVSCGEHTCYPQDAHPRAVYNANKIVNAGIGSDDKPKRVYVRPKYFDAAKRQINVIAFEEASDISEIEDALRVDVNRMTETLLVNPLEEILDAVGVDVRAAIRGQEQTGLGAFSE